jgi:hypothetical protein
MDRDPRWDVAVPKVRAAADALHDHQKQRIRVGNQLQAMTTPQSKRTTNGYFGKGLRKDDPVVIQKAAVAAFLVKEEKKFASILKQRMKNHPLLPWIEASPGLGDLSVGRLLGLIGDPAWHPRCDRPRRLGELNRYCGMDVNGGVAPRRTAGVQCANNPRARTCLIVCADAAIKQRCQVCKDEAATARFELDLGPNDTLPWQPPAFDCNCAKEFPYRSIYDETRMQVVDAVHERDCFGKGSCGRPAGTELNDSHKHAYSRRKAAKAILKDMWREARRIDGISDELESTDLGRCAQSTTGHQTFCRAAADFRNEEHTNA